MENMEKNEKNIQVKVTSTRIQTAEIIENILDGGQGAHGAEAFFFGKVRSKNLGREVVAVSYDAHVPLAEKILAEIAAETRVHWGDSLRLVVFHRTGKLAVGEVSVAIGVSSPHRDEAFRACRYVIEQIKQRAPIWKKEFYHDGETTWVKGHALCQHAHGESSSCHAP